MDLVQRKVLSSLARLWPIRVKNYINCPKRTVAVSVTSLRDVMWTGVPSVNSHQWSQDFSVTYRAKRICAAVC